jgi:hypothetical protein
LGVNAIVWRVKERYTIVNATRIVIANGPTMSHSPFHALRRALNSVVDRQCNWGTEGQRDGNVNSERDAVPRERYGEVERGDLPQGRERDL